jgi:hypothetical protein
MSEIQQNTNGRGYSNFDEIVNGVSPFQRDMKIPERCIDCPGVQAILRRLAVGAAEIDMLTQLALDDGLLASSGCEIIQDIAKATGADRAEVIGKITKAVGETAAKQLEALDDATRKVQELIDQATDGCEGPVRTVGFGRGREIRVTVCNSPVMDDLVGFNNSGENVTVRRDNATTRRS